MATLTFLGHACFLIERGPHRVIIDPFLTGNPKAATASAALPKLDAVLVTHGHGDHLGDAIPLATKHRIPFIASYELARFATDRGAPLTHPMAVGGAHEFPFGHVKLVTAIHGGGVEGDATGKFTTHPCGIVLTMGGTRIYHVGDSALTMDMQLLEGRVDVMCVPIGDNYTMGPDDAARAVAMVKPKVAIPMHFGTFPVIDVDPARFVKAVGAAAKVVVLEPGKSYTAD